MQLFVLNIIMANVVKKFSEFKFHTERPIKLFVIRCKKEKKTSEVFSPGNYALSCLVLFHDLTLGVGVSGIRIESLTRQNYKGFSITPPPPFTHHHPTPPRELDTGSFPSRTKIYTLRTKYSYRRTITYELAISRRTPHLGQFLLIRK